jgi:alkanesulfonate monooxygenase SsuD/methylene tetrahydromethanopterin reductase-like flavin-dependent oxidoreductase (luciferase family)
MFEAYTLLGGIAARTRRLQLGTLVTAVTLRPASVLAKSVTSLDVVSGGRAILGIGAAWDADEHRSYGIPFPSLGDRMDRLDETLRICRAMFTEESPSFAGEHSSIDAAFNSPRPVRGDIPILIGGNGERRTLRMVAELGNLCNLTGRDPKDTASVRHLLDVLDGHCQSVGRDPSDITKTYSLFAPPTDPDELVSVVGGLFEIGIDGVVLFAGRPDVDVIAGWGGTLTKAFPAE